LARRGRSGHRRAPGPALRRRRAVSARREVGPRSRDIVAREMRHIAPGFQSFALYSGLAMARGRGVTLIDEDGNEYIDFIAGIAIGSVGHCHPHYVEALKRQAGELTFGTFPAGTRGRLFVSRAHES